MDYVEGDFANPDSVVHGLDFDTVREMCTAYDEVRVPIICAAAGAAQAHRDLESHADLQSAAKAIRDTEF